MEYSERDPDYQQHGVKAYLIEDEKTDEYSGINWDLYEVACLQDKDGETVVMPLSLSANLYTCALNSLSTLRKHEWATEKQIRFLESICFREQEKREEEGPDPYYELTLTESYAEEEAARELTEEEEEKLRELVNTSSNITQNQTDIIMEFSTLLRSSLNETAKKFEERKYGA
ncbi:hypothetical protein [Salinibacter ruber]|uniref:hypothetical protein n=1 Tax=Salinibacter ruber TaxID=146919 RepID=UPI002169EE70|nr:hypothetical protein [Salinibacter ruber]MCS4119661.1 hypothetical protein [Salinibacter ruber]